MHGFLGWKRTRTHEVALDSATVDSGPTDLPGGKGLATDALARITHNTVMSSCEIAKLLLRDDLGVLKRAFCLHGSIASYLEDVKLQLAIPCQEIRNNGA